MKNVLLMAAFMLLGTFALANNGDTEVKTEPVKNQIELVEKSISIETEDVVRCTLCEKHGNDMYCGSGETCDDAKEAQLAAILASK